MRTNQKLALAAAAMLLGIPLAGCSGSSSAVSDVAAGGAAPRATSYQDAEVTVPEAPYSTVEEKLARSARVTLRVADVNASAAAIAALAQSLQGSVTGENLATGNGSSDPVSTVVISVPSEKLESALEQLRPLGEMTNRNIESEDVGEVVADVDSRVDTLAASLERLRELSKRAGSIKELTALEAQITERTAERDSLLAQQRVLAKRVAKADITISLLAEQPAPTPAPTGFMAGLLSGWEALLASTQVLLQLIGALLPFALAAALVAIPTLVLLRRRRAGGAAAPSMPAAASEEPSSESPASPTDSELAN